MTRAVGTELTSRGPIRVIARSHSGNEFAIELQPAGGMTRECTATNTAGCPPTGTGKPRAAPLSGAARH